MIPFFYNARSLLGRRLSTSLTIIGLALVVFVFACVLMLSHGIEKALAAGGSPSNAVLLRAGAMSEIASELDRDTLRSLSSLPRIATSSQGEPLAVGEIVVLISVPRDGAFINATSRGISSLSFEVRPAIRLIEGRRPGPGTNEIAIGNALMGTSNGAFVGGELVFAGQRWPVVGIFHANGSAYESEIWADRERLAQAFKLSGFNSVVLRLLSPNDFEYIKNTIENDRRFQLKAIREDKYWKEQAVTTAAFIRVLGLFVVFVFSIGAVLGAMITMYAQVASRTRELGMMRAIGFPRRSVLASFLLESTMLGTAGGALGAAGALGMGLVKIRTLNFQTFSEVRFGFSPTPTIILSALLFGTLMGLAGGILPAARAARLQLLEAIRS